MVRIERPWVGQNYCAGTTPSLKTGFNGHQCYVIADVESHALIRRHATGFMVRVHRFFG